MATAASSTATMAPPPIPARSRLRPSASSSQLSLSLLPSALPRRDTETRHVDPLQSALPPSPSSSSVSSYDAFTSPKSPISPGLPVTPRTPPLYGHATPGTAFGFGTQNTDATQQVGTMMSAGTKSSAFAFSELLKKGGDKRARAHARQASLSGSGDPARIKDGVAPRESTSGVYTPVTFYGAQSHVPQSPATQSSVYTPPTFTGHPTRASQPIPGPRSSSVPAPSAGWASYASFYPSQSSSPPATKQSPPPTPTSRVFSVCAGALSSLKRVGVSVSTTSSVHAQGRSVSAPIPSTPSMSTSTSYASTASSRDALFSYTSPRSSTGTGNGYGYPHQAAHHRIPSGDKVQVWTPDGGWTADGLGLGMGLDGEMYSAKSAPMHAHARTRSSSTTHIAVDAPKGRRKPVPKVESESGGEEKRQSVNEEVVHAL